MKNIIYVSRNDTAIGLNPIRYPVLFNVRDISSKLTESRWIYFVARSLFMHLRFSWHNHRMSFTVSVWRKTITKYFSYVYFLKKELKSSSRLHKLTGPNYLLSSMSSKLIYIILNLYRYCLTTYVLNKRNSI
jgi:hypothetical protein